MRTLAALALLLAGTALIRPGAVMDAQGTETISVAMVIMGEMNFGYVAALAMIQAALLFVAFILFRLLHRSFLEN